MHHRTVYFPRVLLIVWMALLLASCRSQASPAPTSEPASPAPVATAAPTATSEPVPPSQTAAPTPMADLALPDPEWSIAYDGDLNQDGRRDVVAYRSSAIVPAPTMDGEAQEMPWTVAEALIMQANDADQTDMQVQAAVSPRGVAAVDTVLLPAAQFGEPGPAAFLMGVDPQAEDAQVQFIPLDETGNAYAQGFGLYWNEGQLAYRLFAGGQAVPPPNVPPGSTLPLHTPLPSETRAPGEIEIVLYWVVGEELQPEYRRIPATQSVGATALELLLAGPQQPGLATAIPTPAEVQAYPGRQPDWGDQVRLLGLTIEDGVATANFSQEIRAYGGGSARVQLIRAQIEQTLLQFPAVQEVQIAVEGAIDTALQP